MKPISKITFFENKKRAETLSKYREWVEIYFSNIRRIGPFGMDGIVEEDLAKEVRPKLNRNLDLVKRIVLASGQNFNTVYQQAPMIGGRTFQLDALDNLFRIPEMDDFDESHVTDVIDRSIGEYDNDYKNSVIRTFNPFFWLWQFIEFIVSLPFKLLGKVGFNQKNVEESVYGKILKTFFYLISTTASFLAIFEILGLLDWLKSFVDL